MSDTKFTPDQLKTDNEKLLAANRELIEALERIIKINAAPTMQNLVDKLKNVAKEAIQKHSK